MQEAEKKAKSDMAKALEEKNSIVEEASAKAERMRLDAHKKAGEIKASATEDFEKKAVALRKKAAADANAKASRIRKTTAGSKKSSDMVKAIIKEILGK